MRSIGKRNINKVVKLTHDELRKCKTPWGQYDVDYNKVEETVIEKLPLELWNTWEMADQEIRRIIDDELTKFSYGHLQL